MKFVDYLGSCLKNPKLRYHWKANYSGLVKLLMQGDSKFSLEYLEEMMDHEEIAPLILEQQAKTEIIFYEEDKDDCPTKEFLDSILNKSLKVKTLVDIAELSLNGLGSDLDSVSYVEDGIFKLKSKHLSDGESTFYFFISGNKIIITGGCFKITSEPDEINLKRAKKFRDIYTRGFKNMEKLRFILGNKADLTELDKRKIYLITAPLEYVRSNSTAINSILVQLRNDDLRCFVLNSEAVENIYELDPQEIEN